MLPIILKKVKFHRPIMNLKFKTINLTRILGKLTPPLMNVYLNGSLANVKFFAQ